MRSMLLSWLKKTSWNDDIHIVKLQSENGLLRIPMNRESRDDIPPSGYLWSHSMTDYIEQGMIDNTARDTNRLLNRFLRRDEMSSIAVRTMTDLVERDGTAYAKAQETWADKVLVASGWDPETVKPLEKAAMDPSIAHPLTRMIGSDGKELTDDERKANIKAQVDSYNEKRDAAKIPEDSDKPFQIENGAASAVYVSLDGVGARRQKDERSKGSDEKSYHSEKKDEPVDYSRAPDSKKRPAVETAVAHIDVDGEKYVFAAKNMFIVCKLVIAFLLTNSLLQNRQLVFLTDGDRDIKACIQNLFDFCPHIVVLDWFHLRKHCNEGLSMMLCGGKANRARQYEIRRTLYHILWAGDVPGAIAYLRSIESKMIKSEQKREELIAYLERKDSDGSIACYAIRRRFHLRTSSNPVEKANDLIVAARQKGKGMSWSREGSWALANVTAMYLNNEQTNWRTEKRIGFKTYREYGKVFAMPKKAA